jgi:hypothetical protein
MKLDRITYRENLCYVLFSHDSPSNIKCYHFLWTRRSAYFGALGFIGSPEKAGPCPKMLALYHLGG